MEAQSVDTLSEKRQVPGGEPAAPPTETPKEESWSDYKARRTKETAGVPSVTPEKPKAEPETKTPSVQPDKGGESAEVSETSQTQEKQEKAKRDRSAEGRIRELLAERDELRKKLESAQVPKPAAEQPKPEAKTEPKPEGKPKPKLKEFLDRADSYEEGYEQWNEAVFEWRDEQRDEQRKAESEKQQRETQQRALRNKLEERLLAARVKYADYDEVTKRVFCPPALQKQFTSFLINHPHGMDVAYHLAQNPEEVARISGLDEIDQIAEMRDIGRKMNSETPVSPEKPKPQPVSRAPKPPTPISGVAAIAKTAAEADSIGEYKRLRRA